jgi:hypothetical protein
VIAVPLVAAGALLAWLLAGTGFANYDTAYSILWGSDLAHGRMPDYSVPVAPTPHPLATLAGLVVSPLGDDAETAWVVLAFAALGALGWVVFALAREWFGTAAGVLAALIVLTREPVLSFGARAYVDIVYLVLVLAAVLVEARRHRAGVPVLVLLGVAGLLRPEAWLFAGLYWLWIGRPLRLLPLVAAGPLIWMAFDWAIAGDPLYSLTGTRDNAAVLQRRTGLDEVPLTVPRRIGEIVREPILLGAAIGGVLALWKMRDRALLPAAVGVISLGAFCVLAAAGLPILGRYLLLPATILIVFAAATLTGWNRGPWWRVGAVVTAIAFVAFIPAQVHRIDRLHGALATQREIRDDLHAIAARVPCAPVAVPNHRPVPLLALWLDRSPDQIVSAQLEQPTRGAYLDPATERVKRNFILDKSDPKRLDARPPAGFEPVAANRSWRLLARC